MKRLSVIIPTKNEEGNIIYLIQRIDRTLTAIGATYEIIFVDDHSTDLTQETIKKLSSLYPVSLHIKHGKPGKAQSLLEGFSYAKYDYIVMIDGDLQYPPETIKNLITKLDEGNDIIVANRKEEKISFKRRTASKSFLFLFGKTIHKMDCDVQSGLKLFKKEIIQRITLSPTPWTFDLEFLVKARNAGYKIGTIDIEFEPRFTGHSKVNLLKTSWEIAVSAIRLKFTEPQIIPFNENYKKSKGNGFHYRGREFIHYSDLKFLDSAFFRLTPMQFLIFIVIAEIFVDGLFINWHATIIALIATITTIYFSDLLFNLFLIYKSFTKSPEIHIEETEIQREKSWPTYTILCPLYKEGKVLTQFVKAIDALDYPKEKLQVLLLLEEDDKETITTAQNMHLPSYISIVIAPHSHPKTKPKALNYGLTFATGKYTVVYDAEDIPEPSQLKKVILAFEKEEDSIICIQAKLNFYNPYQNILTRVFTAEYSLWFDLILTGLQSIDSIIPLGGTSNHFKTQNLKLLKGWDSFNVTEDCDLGLRLVKNGYRTAIVNSTTYEEANSELKNWFSQRGRWIKGYMQTYLVHVRNPRDFIKQTAISNFLAFQLVVGGKIFSLFINPLMWIITISYFIFRQTLGPFIESFFPAPIFYMAVICLVFGNFLYMYYYMIGCAKRGYFSLIKYGYIVPFYWLGMSISGWQALYKIITSPHYWAKTHHGLHLEKDKPIYRKERKAVTYPSQISPTI